ncbi:transcriptional regulator GcvA [Roseibium sp. M-1]
MSALPPLASLRAFEAAARHLSFRRAAGELGVTPTAISHQIRLLEETVGTKLFERRPRKVRLTEAGNQLFLVCRDAFASMSETVGKLRRTAVRRAVTLTTTTAFAAGWLVPRIRNFNLAHPDVTLRIHPCETVVDLLAGDADCAIRYGRAPFAGLTAEPLMEERFAPVCSPRLKVRTPDDLRAQTLLHSVWHRQDANTPSWRKWCALAGVKAIDTDAGTVLSDDAHVIQAAIAGQGIALLSTVLVRDALEAGLLSRPFGPELKGLGYYLVYPPGKAEDPMIKAVRAWLFEEIFSSSG